MKVRKVTDSQIMLLITTKELVERDMNISDIASNSMKAQKLFKEVISDVVVEYGFADDEDPIMVEATPTSDGITIVISKIREDTDELFTISPEAYEVRKFINSPRTITPSGRRDLSMARAVIYEFEDLASTEQACVRLSGIYDGESELYKCEKKYYLVLYSVNGGMPVLLEDLEVILSEYGEKMRTRSPKFSKYYLKEHGETIIKKGAVGILSSLAVE